MGRRKEGGESLCLAEGAACAKAGTAREDNQGPARGLWGLEHQEVRNGAAEGRSLANCMEELRLS